MPKNIFFFTGEGDYLLKEQIDTWKTAFIAKHGDINLAILDAEEMPINEVMAAVNAIPFLSEKRLIFIHNLPDKPAARKTDEPSKRDEKRDEQLKKLEADLKEVPESSVVVFVQSKPDKRKTFYKRLIEMAEVKVFEPFSGQGLYGWIQNRVQKKGRQINLKDAEYLAGLTGQNMWRLTQEIDKLSALSVDGRIERRMIDRLVVPTLEANVFHLTDALGAKDHRLAIRHLHRSLAAGENLRQVFYMIVRQFRLLLQAASYKGTHPGSGATGFAATLKVHSFVARNTMEQLHHFSPDELRQAYARLLEIDMDLKTSGIRTTADNQDELALAIERFIIRFCS